MAVERRRSNRLMLTVPLRVHGTDEEGNPFDCDAQTVDISRHGARIRITHPLVSGEQVRLTNLVNHRAAVFRVAGPVAPLTEKGGDFGVMGPISARAQSQNEWGVGALDENADLWGIRFPPPPPSEDSEPKALISCRQCGATELAKLSLVEVDVLETAGILSLNCATCRSTTPWGFAQSELSLNQSKTESASIPGAPRTERRKYRRAVLQLPILIRDYFGGVEIAKSENVSKGGVCFTTEKNYHLGEGMMIACPYDKKSQNIEVAAQVISREDIPQSYRKIYRVKYKNI